MLHDGSSIIMHFPRVLKLATTGFACSAAALTFSPRARADAPAASGNPSTTLPDTATVPGSEVEAAPESEVAAARELFWRAHQAYGRGDYEQAVLLFSRSYDRLPQAEVLYNIAIANAKGGHCGEAQRAFTAYTKALPAGVDEHASKYATLKRECSDLELETSAPPVPVVDAPPNQEATSNANASPAPVQEAEPQPIPETSPDPKLASAPPADTSQDEEYWTRQRRIGWSLVAAAAASAGAAVYFARREHGVREQAKRASGARNEGDRLDELETDLQRAEAGKYISLGTALGAAATGAVLLVLAEQQEPPATLSFDANGFRVQLRARF